MKRRIRLNRRDLDNIIAESVSIILMEEEGGFRNVDDLNAYVEEKGLQMRPASKFQRINARPAEDGEEITTIASDGVEETSNVANNGDWVVNNISNPDNQWIIDGRTFAKKYEPVEGEDGVYKPKGGPMNAAQIDEPISFTAPWGEQMNIDAGGYILQDPNNPNDIYGISGKDFEATYRFNESRRRSKHRITESELIQIIKECVLLESDFSDRWEDDYMTHERRNNVDPELKDLVIDLHTIASYYEEVWNAAHREQKSERFKDCSHRDLEYAAHLMGTIHDLMMNRSDIMDDQQKMSKEDIEDYCGDSLKKLSKMKCLGIVARTAKRLMEKLGMDTIDWKD